MSSVPTMADAMPISPASTPLRAVRGWLSHFSDKMNSAAATDQTRSQCPSQEFSAVDIDEHSAAACIMSTWESASLVHGFCVSRRNILSMRSVIQNPPTMFVVAAMTASVHEHRC